MDPPQIPREEEGRLLVRRVEAIQRYPQPYQRPFSWRMEKVIPMVIRPEDTKEEWANVR